MLKERAIHGVKWTSLAAFVGVCLQMLQMMILARFLDPRDFGLMALAMVIIGFSQIFLDLGIGNAIIHKQAITHVQLSSLFWLNILIGCGIFLVIIAITPTAARFYGQPELKPILYLVSLTFIIQPFEQQFYALIKKELHFNEIAKRDISAKAGGLLVAVVLAVKGYGVYALVWAQLASASISVFLVVRIGLKYHKPGLHFSLKDTKPFISFGLFQTGDSVCNYFNSQIDAILIGRFLGVTPLGIYNVAKNISFKPIQIINPVITQVSFPVMAKAQADLNRLKFIYLRGLNYLCSVNFSVYAFIIVFADPIVTVLFGPKWKAAVPLLEILALYTMVRSIFNPIGSLTQARGRADWTFWWNFGLLFLIPVIVFAGSIISLWTVGFFLLIMQVLLIIPAWRLLVYPGCGASLREYLAQIFQPLLVAAFIWAALFGYSRLEMWTPVIKLCVGLLLMIVLAAGLNKYLNKQFYHEVVQQVCQVSRRLRMIYN